MTKSTVVWRSIIGLAALSAILVTGCRDGDRTPIPPAPPAAPGPGSGGGEPTDPPAITNATASCFTQGQLVTVTGRRFGSKPNAAPFKWDNFETGAVGEKLTGWTYDYSLAPYPIYSDTAPYAGNRAAYAAIQNSDGYFYKVGLKGLAATEAYASYQFKWELTAADYQPNTFIKLLRFNANPDFYDSRPRSYTSLHFGPVSTAAGYSWDQVTSPEPHDREVNGVLVPLVGIWNRMEVYYKYSEPAGAENGALQTWVNLALNEDLRDILTRADDGVSNTKQIDNFLLPFMVDIPVGMRIYVDNVYVDSTRARVEIGNQAQWDQCTQREIQIPATWSDTEIRFELNRGNLSAGQAYVFIVHADGRVSAGFPVTLN